MDHPVIPAPVRFGGGGDRFAIRPGTRICYAATELEPVVERFCTEVTRRTGLRLAAMAGHPAADEPSVRIELANGHEIGALPAPLGVSPTGDLPADERHSLAIDADRVVVRAAEPAGVARGQQLDERGEAARDTGRFRGPHDDPIGIDRERVPFVGREVTGG